RRPAVLPRPEEGHGSVGAWAVRRRCDEAVARPGHRLPEWRSGAVDRPEGRRLPRRAGADRAMAAIDRSSARLRLNDLLRNPAESRRGVPNVLRRPARRAKVADARVAVGFRELRAG